MLKVYAVVVLLLGIAGCATSHGHIDGHARIDGELGRAPTYTAGVNASIGW